MTDAKKDQNERENRDIDLENCKGQCGYTTWCRDCEKSKPLPEQDGKLNAER